jgi:hypothetical protein
VLLSAFQLLNYVLLFNGGGLVAPNPLLLWPKTKHNNMTVFPERFNDSVFIKKQGNGRKYNSRKSKVHIFESNA